MFLSALAVLPGFVMSGVGVLLFDWSLTHLGNIYSDFSLRTNFCIGYRG